MFGASRSTLVLIPAVFLLFGCSESTAPTDSQSALTDMSDQTSNPFDNLDTAAPAAEKRPVTIEQHGIKRTDPYAWMRDPEWQEVLRDPDILDPEIKKHLEAENQFYESATADLADLREQLFEEMRGRIKEDDSSVPARDGVFTYAVRYREGGDYPIFVRTAIGGDEETVLFDGDAEAGDSEFFRIAAVDHSRDHRLIAYGVDRLGSEYYDIRIREVDSGVEYPETLESTDGDVIWSADSKSFFYVERDDNQRPKRIRHHVLGTEQSDDRLVYEEPDDTYFLGLDASQSGEYLFIVSSKTTSSEYRYLSLDKPDESPVLIAPRLDDELYYVEHHDKHFYIQTNADGATDFKIVRTPVDHPVREQWQDWLAHRPGTLLLDFVPYQDRIVRTERRDALPRIVVSDYARENEFDIDFPEAAYNLDFDSGYEYDTDTIRFTYESPSTPEQVFDYNLDSRERQLLKTQEIPSGHDASLYQVERLFIEADDGARIPVTILRLRVTPVDGSAPLMLYGYGSYGATMQAWFSSSVLSLVDRGVIYATAHIRGSSAMGRQWYLDGKLDKKMNSFTDFANVAETLQERGYGRKGETVIYGGSAGGLLVGATLNLRPDLFGGAIAAVPFVDVINTISDAELPLTPPEWVEWGDPIRSAEAYADIARYSPYDNIRDDIEYPPILATGGVADYRVTYWEPAKWVARLRDEASGGPFFLKMNMGAGHSGSAARFERLHERAHDYAFALKVFGLEHSAVDVEQTP